MKIGFIGCGNMATAIINGIMNNNIVSEKDINAYESRHRNGDSVNKMADQVIQTNF